MELGPPPPPSPYSRGDSEPLREAGRQGYFSSKGATLFQLLPTGNPPKEVQPDSACFSMLQKSPVVEGPLPPTSGSMFTALCRIGHPGVERLLQ